MPFVDSNQIYRLEHIVVDGSFYNLHVSVQHGVVHSAVIGLSPTGIYLPIAKWAAGVKAADAVLGDTSDISSHHAYPYCALFIRQENESVQIRAREHYLIDLEGPEN